MTVDLTGGLDVSREHVFPECPSTPQMRDAVNMWVFDDRGELGLPRIAVEAVAPNWDEHDVFVNVAFPDGRVYRLREAGKAVSTEGPDGLPTVFGAGPLVFRCVEPFQRWTATFAGTAMETSTDALIAGDLDGTTVDVELHVDATMAVPPWSPGSELPADSIESKLMGGPRYEQLFGATGMVRIGDDERSFHGSGLRIRRQGIRDIGEFWGHAWQSALFPSGRAFGLVAYPPRPEGSPFYNEAFLFTGDGPLIPARVLEAPWLTKLQSEGEDVSFVLESELGVTRIEGETMVSVFEGVQPTSRRVVLHQSGVRYRWDGEETYGMLERSSMSDKVVQP
jgi:hypothetical protein